MKLIDELKRRNVFRVAGLYAVAGWILVQAAALLETSLALPAWFDALVISLMLLGLPLAILFAWAFEITPEGLKRTAEVAPETSIASRTGKKLDFAILGGLGLLIAVIAATNFLPGKDAAKVADAETAPVPAGAAAPAAAAMDNANSLAVLPFADMSAGKDQEYFADGISEELLNVLAQVKGLQVAGRTSSFAFKGDNRDLREVAKLLNVAHILEGSVRKSGDQVRITAQLVKASDGFHLWSSTYDRQLTDIFAVQDEIAGAILKEMSPHLPAMAKAAELKPTARADIGAYDLFLLAREKMTQEGSRAAYEQAVGLLDEAIRQDPDYAPALAWRSYAAGMLSEADGGVGETPMAEALPIIKDYADRALAADPASPEGLFAMGNYWGQLGFGGDLAQFDKAVEFLRKAVAARPSFAQAKNDLALYLNWTGEDAESHRLLGETVEHDPGLRDANVTYIYGLTARGRTEEAERVLARWDALKPGLPDVQQMRVVILNRKGRLADAARAAEALMDNPDADSLLTRIASAVRFTLHDADWFVENPARVDVGLGAFLAGDPARAAREVEAEPFVRVNPARGLNFYASRMYAAGRIDKVVDYYETAMKTPGGAMEAWSACDCRLAPLAAALKAERHKDFPELMRLWEARAAIQGEEFGAGFAFIRSEADRAALSGDAGRAAELYSRAIDIGWRGASFLYKDYDAFLPDDPRFDALRARMRDLINAEREKLGMAPV